MLIRATRQYETLDETPEAYSKFDYYDLHPEMKDRSSRKILPGSERLMKGILETIRNHPNITLEEITDLCGLGMKKERIRDIVTLMKGKTIEVSENRSRRIGIRYRVKEKTECQHP